MCRESRIIAHFIVSKVDVDKKIVVTDAVPGYFRFRRHFYDYPNTLLVDQEGSLRYPGSKYPEDTGIFTAAAASRVLHYHMFPEAAKRNEKLMKSEIGAGRCRVQKG